ncbi:class I SAM-dependent methyltransferase [Brevibacillus humidisoli]|uniref:class I SAM-dependent DNA methyltransferase n=1 Tax=Brevibacillus humidisoli TaxID=2895522 RepID=UPI001E32C39F|nr:class I SAM-dependent methyltransferase [Brevibacillus humidisoli]UFJ38893.1 class I SAM-dependent methyltransferase [Brevibacillus humidisoli]
MAYHHLASVYDKLMEDAPYDAWVRWLEVELASDPSFPSSLSIIDLGCGTGSIAIPLAKRGHRVIGVDASSEMLAIASEKMRQARVEVAWVEQDMRQLSLSPVDVVISFCDSLSYLLEEDDVQETFRRVYAHLHPGGQFLFDVHSPYKILHGFGENTFTLLDEEINYIWQCVSDPIRLEVEHQLCFFLRQQDGLYRRMEEVHAQRAYQPLSMFKWLREAGFEQIAVTADFRQEPPHEQSERLFYAARKPRVDISVED